MSADTRATGFDASFEDNSQSRRGRLWTFFAPHDTGFRGFDADRQFTCRLEPADPIRLLAEGDAFTFNAYPTYVWRGHAASREDLEDVARRLMPRARRTVVHVLRPIARLHHPHHAQKFEAAANEQTHEDWRRLSEDGRDVWFKFTVRAEPDEAVQEQIRPYWEARIKSECDHALGLQRAQQADELTRRWSAIFDKLEQDPRAAHAARLSGAAFAEVFGAFVGGKQKAVADLLQLLRDAVNGQGEAGLGPSEYTRAWDEAINAFQQQYGLKAPKEK
jgi:hypothetical protein